MLVQNTAGRRMVGQNGGDILDSLLCLSSQKRKLHLQRSVIVAVRDLTEADLASNHLGEYERVECERQLMAFGDFVSKFEMIWNEFDDPAPSFRWHFLHSPQMNFEVVRSEARIDSDTPSRVLGILRNGRPHRPVALGMHCEQAFEAALAIGLVLRSSPLRINIAGDRFGA